MDKNHKSVRYKSITYTMIFKQIICCVFIFIAFISNTHGQIKKERPGGIFLDTTIKSDFDWRAVKIGFDTDNDEPVTDSFVKIDTILKYTFLKYKKGYHRTTVMDSSEITRTDTSFSLITKNFRLDYPTKTCECTAASYGGLIVPLNLYVIDFADMHNEIGYTYLIDRKTGKAFEMYTDFDYGPEDVLLSVKNNFLLTYANNIYDEDCGIYIYKVKRNNRLFTLNNYLSILLGHTYIKDIVWINDKTLAVSAEEQILSEGNETSAGNMYYLKITIRE
jgi:hypothetical protein